MLSHVAGIYSLSFPYSIPSCDHVTVILPVLLWMDTCVSLSFNYYEQWFSYISSGTKMCIFLWDKCLGVDSWVSGYVDVQL